MPQLEPRIVMILLVIKMPWTRVVKEVPKHEQAAVRGDGCQRPHGEVGEGRREREWGEKITKKISVPAAMISSTTTENNCYPSLITMT